MQANRLDESQGFGGITDIEVGPDGYLYIISYTDSLFRIVPSSVSTSTTASNVSSTTIEDQQEAPSESDSQLATQFQQSSGVYTAINLSLQTPSLSKEVKQNHGIMAIQFHKQ